MKRMAGRGRRLRFAAWMAVMLHAIGCGEERPPPSPARFERPNRVAFVCVQAGEAMQLNHCRGDLPGNALALHALVTQSARGEVAAVNLETERVLDSRRDIPGYTFVPVGESPVAIVVPPTRPQRTYVADYGSRDVRVLDTNALVTTSSSDPLLQEPIQLFDGTTVAAPVDMLLTPDENALIVAAPDDGQLFWLPLQRCARGEADCQDGWIDVEGIVAIPLAGSIDRLLMAPLEPPPATTRYEELCDLARPEPRALAPSELPDPASLPAPRPVALALSTDCPDGTSCSPRLLVADEAQPLIHAVDLDLLAAGGEPASALQTPLFAGVPTRDVVATPFVPATVDGGGETQYVYAVDASDGSVLVLENGRVLSVNEDPTARPDRIAFLGGAGAATAAALEVVTPEFDVEEGAEQWVADAECHDDEHPQQEPRRLRGVFLAVALSDGSIQIVDVHDMEIRLPPEERGTEVDGEDLVECRQCPNGPIPVIVRHHLRLAENFRVEEGAGVVSNTPQGQARFVVDNVAFTVRSDGTTGSPEAPGLECIACDSDLELAFPPPSDAEPDEPEPLPAADASIDGAVDAAADAAIDAGVDAAIGAGIDAGTPIAVLGCPPQAPALICAVADPWLGDTDRWTATFEGWIPGTTGGEGLITLSETSASGGLELADATVDFCAAGVLGREDIGPAYEEQLCDSGIPEFSDDQDAEFEGDQIVLTTQPLSSDLAAELNPKPPAASGISDREWSAGLQRCDELRAALEEDDARPIAFEIRRAYKDHVVITNRGSYGTSQEALFQEVLPCLPPGPLSFEVRTRGAFSVVGLSSGFLHRVRANAIGRCQIDRNLDPHLEGRARLGCTYRNHQIQYKLHLPGTDEQKTTPGIGLFASSTTPAQKVELNTSTVGLVPVSVVATQLRYNPVDNQLYLVDDHARGLVPISLDPFPSATGRSFR